MDKQYKIKKTATNTARNLIKLQEDTKMQMQVPIWQKYTLSIEEAAKYFRIGEGRLRQIASENPNADFLLMNGNRIQIKRKLFERYIDMATTV